MSDRGRPHNLGQVLFESLGAGLKAYGVGLEQERIRKSETAQQSFLNRLREESGARAQTGLEQGQERLDLAQNVFGLSQEKFGFEQEKFGIQQEIDPIEQAQIDASQARTAKLTRETELLGTGGSGRSMFGTGVGSTIFNQLNLGFQLRELQRRVDRGDPQFAITDPETGAFTPRGDIDAGMIATPEDTLRVLLQQAKGITGEAPTTLQGLGKEPVFPRADFDELAQQPGLQQKRVELRQRALEWADTKLPQWRIGLSSKDQEEYLQSVEFRLQQ